MFLLYGEENQLCVYVYPLPLRTLSTPTLTPIPPTTEHKDELPVPQSSFLLAIYFTHSGVYVY